MELMHVTDWLPTLYAVAGGDVRNLRNIDGLDMWNTLSQSIESPRLEILHNIDPHTGAAAYRFRNWKLLVNISKLKVKRSVLSLVESTSLVITINKLAISCLSSNR